MQAADWELACLAPVSCVLVSTCSALHISLQVHTCWGGTQEGGNNISMLLFSLEQAACVRMSRETESWRCESFIDLTRSYQHCPGPHCVSSNSTETVPFDLNVPDAPGIILERDEERVRPRT